MRFTSFDAVCVKLKILHEALLGCYIKEWELDDCVQSYECNVMPTYIRNQRLYEVALEIVWDDLKKTERVLYFNFTYIDIDSSEVYESVKSVMPYHVRRLYSQWLTEGGRLI